MLRQKLNKTKLIANVVASLILIGLSFFIIANRQRIVDQITVWQFKSTTELTGLVERSGMNDYGKFLYLASQPVLDATQSFNSECDRVENTASILGCYSNNRIFVYDVSDPQLDGVREVTATHETLHAAYARLDDSIKNRINVLLEAEYKKLENNKDYSDRMAFYARTEPGERDNELHSVIGTEIAIINPELEQYYNQYFSNRQKSVALNIKYSSVFINLKNKANSLLDQMKALSVSVSTRVAQYNIDVKSSEAAIADFNKRAANGYFKTMQQFNTERAALAGVLADLATTRTSISADIAQYDKLLGEYNSIASESKKLYNSIDSTLTPTPTAPTK